MTEPTIETTPMPEVPASILRLTMTKSEMVLSKIFSAQWIIAIGVTIGATCIVFYAMTKRPEYAGAIVVVYFTQWTNIITSYFKRQEQQQMMNQIAQMNQKNKTGDSNNGT